MQTEHTMKENSHVIRYGLVKEQSIISMVLFIKESSKEERDMVKVDLHLSIILSRMVTFLRVVSLVTV